MKAFLCAIMFTVAAAAWMNMYFAGPGARDAVTEFTSPTGVRL
jgi:hypothetical protein